MAITDVVIENARVLAIDQLADERTDKPSVVKAVTLEVGITDGTEGGACLDGRHAVAAAPARRASAPIDTARRVTAADLGRP